MPDYLNRPEPERHVSKEKIIIEKSNEININELVTSIVEAINIKTNNNGGNIKSETFDDSKTMDRLAEQMLVERSNNSNFNDLGNTVETKKDKQDIDNTIDLLSNID